MLNFKKITNKTESSTRRVVNITKMSCPKTFVKLVNLQNQRYNKLLILKISYFLEEIILTTLGIV